ncbi:MAG: phosphomannomutase/phosphoglucomutase [archaeon]
MNEHIFRQNDIRGDAEKDLTSDVAFDIGRAMATYIKGQIAVGMDCRESSPRLKGAVIKGILSTGYDVLDLGMVTSPQCYFASNKYKADGTIMITGSHCAKNMNGFKLMRKKNSLVQDKIQEIKNLILSNSYSSGYGEIEEKESDQDYVLYFLNKFNHQKKLKIVVDCGNATGCLLSPKILRELGHEVFELYCKIDSSFPNHHPDPTIPKNLEDLKKKVVEEEAHLGLAFDGDGDRIGFIDDKGEIIAGDRIMALVARMLEPKSKVIFDVKCSKVLPEELKKLGHVPIMFRTGNAVIKQKAFEENSPFSGELSGHFFWAENYNFDDALFMGCKLLDLLCNLDLRSLSVISSEIPKLYSTPEVRVSFPDEKKFELINKLRYEFSNEEVIDIDGVRVDFGDGWGLARASQTEPALTFRFEAETEERLEVIKRTFDEKVSRLAKEL